MGNAEETIKFGADAASLEAKCDEDKKQEDNAKDLKATSLNFIKETTMEGVEKAFLEGNCDNDKKQEDDVKTLLMVEKHAHSLDLLMGNIEETTMAGVDIALLEDTCDDDKEQEDDAKALLLLESGSPLFKRKSSKKLGEVENFSSDCYSFLSLHGPFDNPLFFSFGITVYIFQMMFLLLMVLSVLHPKWQDIRDTDNPGSDLLASFIPSNSTPLVQASQFLALLSYILFADASFLDVAKSVETFPTRSAEATKCMVFSCVLRFSQGLMAMFVTLLLIMTSESVIDIVLNFAAVNFISYLDDVAFGLALWGKYGPKLEKEANRITNLPLPTCMTRGNKHTRFQYTLVTSVFPLLTIMIAIMFAQASHRTWLTKVLRVEFESEEMKVYNGCYEWNQNEGRGNKRYIYKSSEDVLESASFGYCIDEHKWKLFTDGNDACKAKEGEVAHSAKSHSFDVSTSFDEGWFSASGTPLDLYFIEFPDKTREVDCSSLGDGMCNEFFNTYEFRYDGGDCCSSTCFHSNCGADAITEGFGMPNTTGMGFPNCKDPSMVAITISLENFISDHDPEYLAQRFTPELIEEYESEKDKCKKEEISSIGCDKFLANTISPSLSLTCESKLVLLIDINPNMSNSTETVFVNDGATCTINMANRSAQDDTEDIYHPAIWFVNFSIFQGYSVENRRKILGMNSGEQGISSFFPITNCITERLIPFYQGSTSIYIDKYQFEAVKWMMEDNSGNSDCRDDFFIDRYVLSVMNVVAPIANGKGSLWIEETPQCTWSETDCYNGALYALKLDNYDLNGVIPSEIGLLSTLKELRLSDNGLSGVFPSEICLVSSLQVLDLGHNTLSGVIPSGIGLLSSLQKLDIYNNGLSGVIPSEIGLLSSLQELDLESNDLSGVIPSEIGLLSSLQRFYLSNNDLSGVIPSEIGLLSSLQRLYSSDDGLSGVIPSEIGLLSSLQVLQLESNDLSGVIPSEIGLLSSLQRLNINSNGLSGVIPSEIGLLSSLQELHISNNGLSGVIPSEIGLLTNLRKLSLEGNNLIGLIPSGLGLLNSLIYLGLDIGNFTPPIPNIFNVFLCEDSICKKSEEDFGTISPSDVIDSASMDTNSSAISFPSDNSSSIPPK